tara:strand:+ start:89 stop:346 length:258 start_codon:yes stop_codon:yes gene_type:complete
MDVVAIVEETRTQPKIVQDHNLLLCKINDLDLQTQLKRMHLERHPHPIPKQQKQYQKIVVKLVVLKHMLLKIVHVQQYCKKVKNG